MYLVLVVVLVVGKDINYNKKFLNFKNFPLNCEQNTLVLSKPFLSKPLNYGSIYAAL